MRTDFGYAEEDQLGKAYDIGLLKRLYPLARPYLKLFGLAVVLVMGITALDIALPYVTKIAIDRYIVPAQSPKAEAHERQLTVDLTQPGVTAIVKRYSADFKVDGQKARIAYEALAHLAPDDLRELRRRDLAGVGLCTLAFLLLVLLIFGLTFVHEITMAYVGQMVMHDLRMRLFTHMQGLSLSFFNRHPLGRLVTRVTNDVQNMQELFASVVTFFFKDLFLLFGIAIVLLVINYKLALVSFAVLPFVLAASFYFARRARDVFRTLRVKMAEINSRFSETINGVWVIQMFAAQKRNYNTFERLNHENYLAGMHQINLFAVFMPVVEWLATVAVALVIWSGGHGVMGETLSLGALVAFISYMKMFFRPIRDMAEKYNILQNAMASAERIFQILDSREHTKGPKKPVEGGQRVLSDIQTISFENVSFAYSPEEPVLKGISFTLQKGESLAVVGPTGAGKTTLMNLLFGFYEPLGGKIRINGIDIRQIPRQDLRKYMAVVMQEPFLFSDSVRNNIWPPGVDVPPSEIDRVLSAANCESLVRQLPQGLDTVLSEGGTSISSGERQLLAIARALAHVPRLIIFDEATSYVDSHTEERIQQAVGDLMRRHTALIIAHRLQTARTADRILVLHHGRVIESGSHADLMAAKGFYHRLNQMAV